MHPGETQLRLYSTLTKREEPFVLQHGETVVRMYTCGPTVYGRPHIGNLSAFLMADLLRRWLEAAGYHVRHVKNITDVGHLVRDSENGEDKIERQAREEHGEVTQQSVLAVARQYEAQYIEDEQALHMLEPEARPRASEYIAQMCAMVESLLESGIAYITHDGIYFDITRFPAYGLLSGNKPEHMRSGARVDINAHKRHPADFALWKFCVDQNAEHILRWPSPGEGNPEGFPGWHIECSAMSGALLGDTIDIHTGGEDNIFPHHECEIAQSESVSGKQFVRYWLHKRRIDLAGEKMSKSLGNVLTLPDIVAMGFAAMDVRYYLLSVHYRTNLAFSQKGLSDAKAARRRIVAWMDDSRLRGMGESDPAGIHAYTREFCDAMNADLNTPAALAAVFGCMKHVHAAGGVSGAAEEALVSFIALVRQTFGCFDTEEVTDALLPSEVCALRDKRANARLQKDFAASDALRMQIEALGYTVRDEESGQVITPA